MHDDTATLTAELARDLQRVLPATLWELPLTALRLPSEVTEALAGRGFLTVGDALVRSGLDDAESAPLRAALTRALDDGLRQFSSAASDDWPSLRAQLLGPLDDAGRRLLTAAVGLEDAPRPRPALQSLLPSGASLDEELARVRTRLLQHCPALLGRLRDEVEADLRAFDGVLMPQHAAAGTLVQVLRDAGADPLLGLRLAAFCLPHDCHLHRGVLHGTAPRSFRELLRSLPSLVPQHRLPLAIDAIASQLYDLGVDVPHGVLLHVLRTELRVAIELDGVHGEMAVPDPRTPAARLVEILQECGAEAALDDLVFGYRERFRFASKQRLLRQLRGNSAFLQVGDERWALRQWHEQELAALQPLVEQTARLICSEGGRHRIADLLPAERNDERTRWLVLDRLADDPRVRMLGRGEACPADQQQSTVMQRLLRAFRRAAGDVVESRFVQNQPPAQRRLVERLLRHNRAFVKPCADRIDTLSNYPFNQERMQRLLKLVREHLQQRTGYAQVEALKAAIDHTDLGGDWLTPELLTDVLRRNGPFAVLAPGIIALAELALPQRLLRAARQALRELDEAVTVADVLRARPELAEFADCLADLLGNDPLVQSPDGCYFKLA
ncbi:MAG: hypothetical protein H6835_06625 [Planctomycetes bacterium]|nr:hypothetical protein [Planctomycetota bacterium]